MMHLRVISAADLTESVVNLLQRHPAVANLIVHPGAARSPVGDVVIGDIAREALSDVIALDEVALSISPDAERAEQAAPGLGSDAVVWQQIEQTTGEESRLTVTFLIFLVIATIIAGVAGMLSLTTPKSGTLIGVLISVTTVPAAANAAVAFTYGVADEAWGSLLQLMINLASIVLAGVLTLLVQRLVTQRHGGRGAARLIGASAPPHPHRRILLHGFSRPRNYGLGMSAVGC